MMDSEQPGKIFVGGLSVDIDEKAMEDAFGKYGRITQSKHPGIRIHTGPGTLLNFNKDFESPK